MVTEVKPDKRETALTILARMIVRAYLGEIDRGEAGPNAYKDIPPKHSQKPQGNVQSEGSHE
jgi:hypothetical protein